MKRILALALTLVMVLSLAACGGSDTPASDAGGDTSDSGNPVVRIGGVEPATGGRGGGGKQSRVLFGPGGRQNTGCGFRLLPHMFQFSHKNSSVRQMLLAVIVCQPRDDAAGRFPKSGLCRGIGLFIQKAENAPARGRCRPHRLCRIRNPRLLSPFGSRCPWRRLSRIGGSC